MRKFEITILKSEELERNVKIYIYLPKDYYNNDESYPVLYINDGQVAFNDYENLEVDWGLMDDYITSNTKKEVILIGIDSRDTRLSELAPFELDLGEKGTIGGKVDLYLNFIIDTLMPYINNTYRTLSDPKDTGLMGISLGGATTFYAAAKYNKYFNRFAMISSSHSGFYKQLKELLQNSDLSNILKLYSDVGTKETDRDNVNEIYLKTNKELHTILESKLEESKRQFIIIEDSRHEFEDWNKRFTEIINYTFS